jgi:uncharacterized protein (DUF1778 family)
MAQRPLSANGEPSERIGLKMTREQRQGLERIAASRGTPLSSLVREAVDTLLAEELTTA